MDISLKVKLFKILFFGSFGITIEIFFTAIMEAVGEYLKFGFVSDFSFIGHSYIWMFPIYSLIPLLFPIAYKVVKKYHVLIRGTFYMLCIFIVEYFSGWFLDLTMGKCPWEYNSKWAIHGYINLSYAPAWILFSLIAEYLNRYIDKITNSE